MNQPPSSGGLRIRGLSKRYGDVHAVAGVDLDVSRGALIGFLGPNGAGKTTTMRSVVGMVRPDGGSIEWDGKPVDDSVRTRTGYMPQERGLYARMKVREQIVYFGRLAGMTPPDASRSADRWIERLGLGERTEALVQELSGGNQQRVQLAVSLVHDPDLLILDEPFSGLDPVAAETMRAIIAERAEAGAAVLFSSHQLDLVEGLCEHVVIIADGRRIAAGTIADLRAASPTRRLQVRWSDAVERWSPIEGRVIDASDSHAEVELPATADVAASIAHAAQAGAVASVSVEPPGLDEVFVELIDAAGARRATEA